MNYLHKYLLVQAELSRVTGKKQKDENGKRCDAEELYDRAIASARENEYQQNEAIGNELAAKFYLAKGRTEIAGLYMRKARDGFERWGATAKVRQLEEKYPELLADERRGEPAARGEETPAFTTVEIQSRALDYASALKASQAIAGEIEIDALLSTIMRIAIENAGASHGRLIAERDGVLVDLTPQPPLPQGEGEPIEETSAQEPLSSRERGAAEPGVRSGVRAPISLVNLALRTREPAVSADAASDPRLADDPYVRDARPRSALCLPLVNQGRTVALIYLENDRAAGVFTPERIETLSMILAQAAVSLENARLYASMDARVRERTRELEDANDKLKSLDRAKSEFFANISHELRTPLTMILTPVASVIEGDYAGPPDRAFFERLRSNGTRLLGLINDLLDFSKIEAGKMTVHRRREDAAAVLGIVAANFHSAATAKGIDLSYAHEPVALFAGIDRNLFEKAVGNVLANAIKFTDPGGRVRMELEASGDSLTVRVSDTGIGIPADKLEAIFERFYQVDASATRRYEGTGIGLAFAKEIVELHGGTIRAESSPGSGSTFIITMPLGLEGLEADDDGDRRTVPDGAMAGIPAEIECEDRAVDDAAGRMETVLAVEDHPDMLEFLRTVLGTRYGVITATNGREAWDILSGSDDLPDLVLADVMMPEMDGYELTERIRKDARFEGMPVILLTAKAETSMKIEGLERGATDYVVKPFNARELHARINAQLSMKRLRDKLEQANRALYRRLAEKTTAGPTVSASSEEKVARVIEFIKENFTADISREGLAAAVNLSADRLSTAFNKVTGKRIDEYINDLRVEEAKRRLTETDETVIGIAFDVGFENVRTFNKVFAKMTGMAPSAWRKGKRA